MVGSKYRPYIQPPYKYQTTNYERRMRRIRRCNLTRALRMADSLRQSTLASEDLENIVSALQEPDTQDKFKWIEATVAEMDFYSAPLNYNGLTRARVRRLQDITQGFLAIIRNEQRRRSRCSTTVGRLSADRTASLEENGQREKDLETAKVLYADLLESIALPFWPRKKTVATVERKSVYDQEEASRERKKLGIKFITKVRRKRSRRSTQMRKSQTHASRPTVSSREERPESQERPQHSQEEMRANPVRVEETVPLHPLERNTPSNKSVRSNPSARELKGTEALKSTPSLISPKPSTLHPDTSEQRLLLEGKQTTDSIVALAESLITSETNLGKVSQPEFTLHPNTSEQRLLLEGKQTTDSIVALAESLITSETNLGNVSQPEFTLHPNTSEKGLLLEGKQTTDSIVDLAESLIASETELDNVSRPELSWRYDGH